MLEKTVKTKKILTCALFGAICGICNGFFGGGGGMIIVPMLSLFMKYPLKKAHATAILIILPLSVASGIFYATFGSADVSVLIPTGIGVIIGGVLGAKLLSKLSQKKIAYFFCFVMLAAGVKALFF